MMRLVILGVAIALMAFAPHGVEAAGSTAPTEIGRASVCRARRHGDAEARSFSVIARNSSASPSLRASALRVSMPQTLGKASMAAATVPLAEGALAPDFTLTAHDGRLVNLAKELSEGPVVLVFYRGSWCPFCVAQLKEYQTIETGRLFAISVDEPRTSSKLATKIAKDGSVRFPLLADPMHATIDAYGLHDSAYDGDEFDGIPRAAVYVVGMDGRVVWSRVSEDYKHRPTAEEIKAVLARL